MKESRKVLDKCNVHLTELQNDLIFKDFRQVGKTFASHVKAVLLCIEHGDFEMTKEIMCHLEFEDKEMIVSIGRFGPYVRHDSKFYSLKKDFTDSLSGLISGVGS